MENFGGLILFFVLTAILWLVLTGITKNFILGIKNGFDKKAEIQGITTLEISGEFPVPEIGTLNGDLVSYVSTITIQVKDVIYYLFQLKGGEGDALAAYSIDSSIAWRLKSCPKNKSIMILKQGDKVEIAFL